MLSSITQQKTFTIFKKLILIRYHITISLGGIGGDWFLFWLQRLTLCDKFGKDALREQAVVFKLAKESIINDLKDRCELLTAFCICHSLVNFCFWWVGGTTAHEGFAKTNICYHFLVWYAIWLYTLLLHTSSKFSYHCIFCQDDIRSCYHPLF